MSDIHPSAVVDPTAELGDDVVIGPFCTIGADVRIGDRCKLISHVVIDGPGTIIGADNTFFPFGLIGGEAQVLKDIPGNSHLVVGDRNTFRESVSIHSSIEPGGKTRIGNDNLIMSFVHVAHDCTIGDSNILTAYVGLSGHVHLEDFVTMGGKSGAMQRCRVGSFAYIGGASVIDKDVPPYAAGSGDRFEITNVNIVGLKRRGVDRETIAAIVEAHRLYYRSDLEHHEAIKRIAEGSGDIAEV